jgi:penicillin-binding protein 2
MRKTVRVLRTPTLLALLVAFVLAAPSTHARTRAKSTKQKPKTASNSKVTVKGGKAARAVQGSRRNTRRNTKATSNQPKFSQSEIRTLLRKRGKLTKAERQKLAAYRATEARRRRAVIEARLRAIRARDEALRNIAAANVMKDNSTGEDLEIRRAAIEALAGRAGKVVVMDPNNGRVFTIINQQMALGSPVKPCSTVKLIVGLGALHEGVFDPNLDVPITARYSMNLTDALAHSNNPFFQVLGRQLGFEKVMSYAQNYGFGETTGVNYPGESPGFLPEEETRLMPSHGDGFGVTAMQLATFTSAIANGGNLYIPRVPRTAEDAADFKPVLKRKVEMTPEDRLRALAGMSGAVNFGTAKLAYDPLGQVAGKTGTCTGATDKLGLFTSFSSVDNPQLVVTVITTGSTEAGKRAADIAGRVYRAISFRFFKQPLTTPASAATEFPRIGGNNNNN